MKSVDFQIIANLMSGDGSARKILEELKFFLQKQNQIFNVLEITKPTPISKLPQDGHQKIKKAVVCLGGDGTVSETVGYILNHQVEAPLAIIPTGTANIIASSLGLLSDKKDFNFLLNKKTKEVY
ncbi:MAG: acylglycerol kinase family protein [Patescibacteria group bacterium]|nr:acylglycerol kinase family protein [Patescibacteria group bacterium]